MRKTCGQDGSGCPRARADQPCFGRLFATPMTGRFINQPERGSLSVDFAARVIALLCVFWVLFYSIETPSSRFERTLEVFVPAVVVGLGMKVCAALRTRFHGLSGTTQDCGWNGICWARRFGGVLARTQYMLWCWVASACYGVLRGQKVTDYLGGPLRNWIFGWLLVSVLQFSVEVLTDRAKNRQN